jgi:hypothetical protein
MSYIASTESSVKSKQTIFRSDPEHGYTKLSNAMLQDSRLSYDTRGLLAELLSRPDDWEITVISIVKRGGAGRDKVYRMFKELHGLGYAKVDQDRNDGGKFEKQRYWVTDDPQFMIAQTARELDKLIPLPENTETVVPFPKNPESVKRARMAENSQYSPLPEKPETAEPLTAQPLTGLPLTANPTHTNKRELLKKDNYTNAREEGCKKSAIAATVVAGIATAMCALPVAANPVEPPAIVQQIPATELTYDQLLDKLMDAGGQAMANMASCPGLMGMSEVHRWLEQSCDLEKDVVPAIRSRAAKMKPGAVKSWAYFTDAVVSAKASRITPLPKESSQSNYSSAAGKREANRKWLLDTCSGEKNDE